MQYQPSGPIYLSFGYLLEKIKVKIESMTQIQTESVFWYYLYMPVC